MIRYATITIIILTCSGLSFFAGYFLNREAPTESGQPVTTTITRVVQQISEGESATTIQEFEQIDEQFTIFAKLKFAHELADLASVEQLQSYISRAARSRDPLYNYNLVSVFLEKYTELDPQGAIVFVDSNPNLADHTFIAHVVTSWVRTDPEAAIDYFKSITDPNLKNTLAGRLLADPTLGSSGFNDEIVAALGANGSTVASIMTVRQLPPAMAFEEALNLDPRNREAALHTALYRWIRESPDEAIARILQHDNNDEKLRMMQGILNEYVSIDEDAAFAFAQTHLTGNARTEQHMLSMLAQRNPKRTLPLVEDFISRTGNIGPLNGILSTWVQQEPQAALAYIETLDPAQQSSMYNAVAYSYVNSHPLEGFQWLLSQRDAHPQMVRNTITSSINHATLNIAERTIGQISDETLKTQLIVAVGNYKASQDPDSALSWLEQYRSDPAYQASVQNVISTMAYQNPRGAARYIEGRLDDQTAAPLVGQIATNWYRASPNDALSWVNSLDEGDAKSSALSNMAMMMVQQDPDEAKRIIQALPEGQFRDNAKRSVAYTLLGQSPGDVDEIIAEYDITGRDAEHMREMANTRNRMRATSAGIIALP